MAAVGAHSSAFQRPGSAEPAGRVGLGGDEKPDVFFVFVPAGDHALAVTKTYGALGMKAAGI